MTKRTVRCSPIGAEVEQEEAGDETDRRGEELDHHERRGVEVARVSGEHQLALLLLQIAHRGEPLEEVAHADDDRADGPLGQRFGQLVVTGATPPVWRP